MSVFAILTAVTLCLLLSRIPGRQDLLQQLRQSVVTRRQSLAKSWQAEQAQQTEAMVKSVRILREYRWIVAIPSGKLT